MDLSIDFIAYKRVRLVLEDAGQEHDHKEFGFERDLDTALIEKVDKLLKRNRIDPPSLQHVSIRGDIDKNTVAYTIARTWVVAWEAIRKKPL